MCACVCYFIMVSLCATGNLCGWRGEYSRDSHKTVGPLSVPLRSHDFENRYCKQAIHTSFISTYM